MSKEKCWIVILAIFLLCAMLYLIKMDFITPKTLMSPHARHGLYMIKTALSQPMALQTRLLPVTKLDEGKTENSKTFFDKTEAKKTGPVQWRLYGKEKWNLTSSSVSEHQEFSVENQPLLDTVPKSFQMSLLSGLPLDCHPGPEGVFKQKHSKFLNVLAEYALEHSKMKNDPSSKTLIWKYNRDCSGLGDRVRGTTFGLLLAVLSQRRLIILFDSEQDGKYIQPNVIDWRDEEAYQYFKGKRPKTAFSLPVSFQALSHSIKSTNMTKHFQLVQSNQTNVAISTNLAPSFLSEHSSLKIPKWITTAMEYSGLAGLSVYEINSIVGIAVRFLFKFEEVLFKELHGAMAALGLSSPYTALHIRTGFIGMSNQEPPHKTLMVRTASQWSANFQCALSAADKSLSNSSLIFLATDSRKVKEMAMKEYPHRFRALDSKIVHYRELVRSKSDKGMGSRAVEEGGLAVWIELFLMAQASTLVRGSSGFSAAAAYLCGLEGNRTVSTSNS